MTASGPAVVVVGGGAVGLSCAWHAAELGCRDVVVLEREHVGVGSSGLSAGIYTRQYTTRRDVELRVQSYETLCDLERAGQVTLVRNGFVRLAHDAATLERFDAGAGLQRELGATDTRVVDPAELTELVPHMDCSDIAGGLYSPSDGYLDGHELCAAFRARAEAGGARVLERTGLEYAEEGANGWRLRTSAGDLGCDVVINAAGAWATQVGEILGAPVRLVSERHQVCIAVLDAPLGYVVPSVMDYVPGSGEMGLYFRQEGENQLLAGLHTNEVLTDEPEDPDSFKRSTDAAYVEEVAEKLMTRLPGLEHIGLRDGWAGLYPNSPDGEFIIGPAPDRPSVVQACGVGGVGLYTSPMVGRLAAEWARYGEPRGLEDAESFSPARFSGSAGR